MGRLRYYAGYGELSGVGKADGNPHNPHLLRTRLRPVMKHDLRGTAAFALDLYITPANSADARSKRLHHRLFRRKSTRQLGRTASAVGLFCGRVDLLQESAWIPGVRESYPLDLD